MPFEKPVAAEPAPSALSTGRWRCHGCAGVCEVPAGVEQARCPRCDAAIMARQPDSIGRTWAWLLAATALYLPANLLPVTATTSLAGAQVDTIFSGIVFLWEDGSWALAGIVFVLVARDRPPTPPDADPALLQIIIYYRLKSQ